ncbi:MAG: YdiU family protein [Pseudomonadota bacterium]
MTSDSVWPPILSLQEVLLTPVEPASFPSAILRYRNDRAADEVGLGTLSDEDWLAHFAQFTPLADNLPGPMAMAYHGHQFQVYNPDIGDGRGFLFAQLEGADGRLMDLGTKGSGQTPFSRTGDGRLTLKGAYREILATEMLEALGVPTSRTLSVIETGEKLARHDEPSPARSAVLVRLNHSHIRFGSFQRLTALDRTDDLASLLSYSIQNFFPDLSDDDAAGFLEAVSHRMATMSARMMAAGFVHGVLNTDNMNITGESFDYGPWRFAPTVDPNLTAAYFDHQGLYAFGRQPQAIYWNLAALADALRPLGDAETLQKVLEVFPDAYAPAFSDALCRRLGVDDAYPDDPSFASDLFTFLHNEELPFERAIFDLFGGSAGQEKRARSRLASCYEDEGRAILARLDALTPAAPERLNHPIFAEEPPTLIIDEVEEIWAAIADRDDWQPFAAKCAKIRAYGDALALPAAQ